MFLKAFQKKNIMIRRFNAEAKFRSIVEEVIYINKVDNSGRIFLALGRESKGSYVVAVHIDFSNPISPYSENGYTQQDLAQSEKMFEASLNYAEDANSMLEILEGYEEYAGEFFNRIPELVEMKKAFLEKDEVPKKAPATDRWEQAGRLAFGDDCDVKVGFSTEDLSNAILVVYGKSKTDEKSFLYVAETNIIESEDVPVEELAYRVESNKLIFPTRTAFELYREAKSDEERRILKIVS